MSRKKQRKPAPPAARPTPERLLDALEDVHALIGRQRFEDARDLLEELDRRYPGRADVLQPLVAVNQEMSDDRGMLRAAERLVAVASNDPIVTLVLAGSYMMCVKPVLALRTFRRFLDRWPDHDQAPEARKMLAELEPLARDILEQMGLTGEEGRELAELHEAASLRLDLGEFAEARRMEEQLLRRRPDFLPARNNISQTYALEGRFEEAIATARAVIDTDPANIHALSNLIRMLCQCGRVAEAREWGERLKAVEGEGADVWAKKAEAFSFLGEDEAILEVFRAAEWSEQAAKDGPDGVLYHRAAVACMRLGREVDARRLWEKALEDKPNLEAARENLEELGRPVEKRNAPWTYELSYWLPRNVMIDMVAAMAPAADSGSEEALARSMRRLLRKHPHLPGLVPLLLELGDPAGREFAMQITAALDTPEMRLALRDFALSQRGPDAMRMRAAQVAARAGLFSPGPVRVWLEGEWREVHLMGYELHGESITPHSSRVMRWLEEATAALGMGQGEAAERVLQQALEVEPEAPDILHNLAVSWGLQGRKQEAEALMRHISTLHPDHVFSRVSLARLRLSEGKVDEAAALLEPLLARRRFHFGEFGALAGAHISVLLARGDQASARSWLDMWAAADPDHPELPGWRRRLGPSVR